MEDISNKAWIFRPDDIVELDTTDEDAAKTIKLSDDKDRAREHLDYIASGCKDRDDDERIRDVFTHKSVAEQRRNEEERGR